MKKNYYYLVFCLLLFFTANRAEAQLNLNPNPSRVVGQPKLDASIFQAPNLVEGREFNNPQAIAVDNSANPPILYVADTGNSRVLAWKNASSFSNGQLADLVIGQKDRFSTRANGPGISDFSTGLNQPAALAVDKNGNLYVADAGNNRILRYPQPFSRPADSQNPDLIIGQKSFFTRAANQGQQTPNEKTIAVCCSGNGAALQIGLAFDGSGNLWFSDSGNNRVLRYQAGALTGNEPAADLELGQLDFVSNVSTPITGDNRIKKTGLANPSSLAFDQTGRLFIADDLFRVLVYAPPFSNGMPAARILGVDIKPNPPVVSDTNIGSVNAVFTIGNIPFIIDTNAHRILRYDALEQWPAEVATTLLSPPAKGVVGQPDFTQARRNRGQPEPSGNTLLSPTGAAVSSTDIFILDAGNNRVLAFPFSPTFANSNATRVLGQDELFFNSVNLIEGREFWFLVRSLSPIDFGGGIVVDLKSDPPHLYVADPGNNRILGFRDVRKVRPGDTADLVIGQPDLRRSVLNYPLNDALQVTDQGLFGPVGVALDAAGNLFVADTGNGRVLRYPKPFDQTTALRPNLVIGQPSFFGRIPDASASILSSPYGLVFTADGHLLVSDISRNRVLLFRKPSGGDFSNGQAASTVFGQPNFSTVAPDSEIRMAAPRHIAIDSDDRLYVADTGHNRILIYSRVPTAQNDPSPALSLAGLDRPHGLYVSAATGEIWVTDYSNNGRISRYPRFDLLGLNPAANFQIAASTPVAVTLDAFGDLLVAEATNRVSLYYPGLKTVNAANFFRNPLTPGMFATIQPPDNSTNRFGEATATATAPFPLELGDVQVLLNDAPVPLYYVSPTQINFIVPNGAPTSGTAEIQVVKKSVGQILASFPVQFDLASPGLFLYSPNGPTQIAAINEDGKINGPTSPVRQGQVISLYGTGQGFVPGAPPDGVAATGAVSTDEKPKIIIGTNYVPDENVLYSGLAPGLPGVWQINVKIPEDCSKYCVAPGSQVLVVVQYKGSYFSNTPLTGAKINTTIAVAAK